MYNTQASGGKQTPETRRTKHRVTMSTFTDYDEVSKGYDICRRATNMDLLVGMVTHLTKKPLKELSVLDAGCGTGNYALGLLDAGVGHVTMMDGSDGMLQAARKKTANYQNNTEYRLGKLPQLPFPDNSFDVIMFNQVLHHLDDKGKDDNRFPAVRETLSEATRVLKKGGVIVIDITTYEQHQYGFWFISLLGVTKAYSNRTPPLSLIREVLQDGGCSDIQHYVQLERILMDYKMYSDLEGALDPSWQKADSSFSEASPEQIDEFCKKIRIMKAEDTLRQYFEQCEQSRLKVGQAITIFARK
ncbi:demethylmenaquinone methyltransferase-like isoform X2 [Gigantopelta aegis]|uniref:demethylmenaquinone methyltransferase-like isoform X2 n=1 Tax=Gigantopelta aegis TaxID=1735272 RepID=UPI001B88BE13|nr:demethylmenaquinone methyltransferase-like isoform X2 [Gigantopelta aegis]